MATDCEKLSESAQRIFERLRPYFPPDSWKKPQYTEEGKVCENGWYDLRLSADRTRLISAKLSAIATFVEIQASMHRDGHGSLEKFTESHFPRSIQYLAEQLLILRDLDFQIETGDLVGM
jgi:hypothetical protein